MYINNYFKCKLNAPTKRHRLAEWIQKQDLYICCLQKTHLRPQDTYRLKERGWKNIFHANGKQKRAGVAILISGKIDLKEDYKRQGRMLHNDQETIQEEDITIVNVYAPNIEAPQYVRKALLLLLSHFSCVRLCVTP